MAKLKTTIKINIQAMGAKPTPPVGPALGQHGVKLMDFCNQFNQQTQGMEGTIPALINIYDDGSFDFTLKTPPVASLIKKHLKIEKGSGEPNKSKVGEITRAQLEEIAKTKMPDLNTNSLEEAINIVKGTARSMGVTVQK